jgi:hypothetical protein
MAAPSYTAARGAALRADLSALLRWSGVLVAGCALAAAAGLSLGDAAAMFERDAELGTLLRGMALIKAALVIAAAALIVWRLRQPVSTAVAFAYLAGAWAMSFATGLIWQLSMIPAAALLFHAGEIGLLLLAWRDGRWARALGPRRRG